jgi:hypothetical protein
MTKRKRKRKRGREGKRVLFPVYVDPECLARFDRIADIFDQKLPASAPFNRADGARAAINVGLKALEAQYGLTAETKEGDDKQ